MRPDVVRKYSRPAETRPRSGAESREDDIPDSPGVEVSPDESLESGPACARPGQTLSGVRMAALCVHSRARRAPGSPGAGRCLRAATPVKRARKHGPGPAHRRVRLTGPARRQHSLRCSGGQWWPAAPTRGARLLAARTHRRVSTQA